jgi:hypothetical protein
MLCRSWLQGSARRRSHVHCHSRIVTVIWVQRRIFGKRLFTGRNGKVLRLDHLNTIVSAAVVVRLRAMTLRSSLCSSEYHIIVGHTWSVYVAMLHLSWSSGTCRLLTRTESKLWRSSVEDSISVPSSQRWRGCQVNNRRSQCWIHGSPLESIPYR